MLALVVAAGCADSKFQPNAEDSRRLALLRADPLTAALTGCTESLAHYRPSTGEPLDFAAVEDTEVRCSPPPGHDEVVRVLRVADAAGWTPTLLSGSFRLRKRFGDLWATARVSSTPLGLSVDLALPPHTGEGFAPAPLEAEAGRACAGAVLAGSPPPAGCPLP